MDEINRKILSALYQDGRLSNMQLSLDLGINQATVARRKERMLSENLFVIKAVYNPFKIVFKARAFIILSVDLTRVNSVCSSLVHNPRISWMLTAFGNFNVLFNIEFNDWDLLIDYVKKDIASLEGIKDIEIHLISEIKKRNWHYFTPNKETDSEPLELDAIDYRLIEELGESGDIKYPYLVEKLGISSATVSRRIAYLLNKNIIKIVAVPNPAKLEPHITAIIHIRLQKDKLDDICAELSSYPQVHTITTLITNLDVIIRVGFPTSEMLHNFISEKIARIDGVVTIKTYVRAEIKKIFYSVSSYRYNP